MVLFTILFAVLYALLEVQIEGNNPWAKSLPTWKVKNPLKKLIPWPYLTGYHFYMLLIFVLVFHMPYFLGESLSIKSEITTWIHITTALILEDFFWFLFNPDWKLKGFFTKKIKWHGKKIFFLPLNYWLAFGLIALLTFIKTFV